MNKIACIYTSHEGQTLKICQKIFENINLKEEITWINLLKNENIEINEYKTILIAGSVRYGKFSKKLIQFINDNETQLNQKTSIFISVNLIARKKNRQTPLTNTYTRKLFCQINWQPTLIQIFAGACRYSKYNYFQKKLIQFIMKITKGPTKTDQDIEFTNWDHVKEFSNKLQTIIKPKEK